MLADLVNVLKILARDIGQRNIEDVEILPADDEFDLKKSEFDLKKAEFDLKITAFDLKITSFDLKNAEFEVKTL